MFVKRWKRFKNTRLLGLSRDIVLQKHEEMNPLVKKYITVSQDGGGSWDKRIFTSIYGLGTVTDI